MKFINDVLKKGSKIAITDLEGTLDHGMKMCSISVHLRYCIVVMLYGFIRDKDVFERDYRFFLSNRLLNGLSQSEYHEKQMIGKLKTECSYQWTSKLEGMFKVGFFIFVLVIPNRICCCVDRTFYIDFYYFLGCTTLK